MPHIVSRIDSNHFTPLPHFSFFTYIPFKFFFSSLHSFSSSHLLLSIIKVKIRSIYFFFPKRLARAKQNIYICINMIYKYTSSNRRFQVSLVFQIRRKLSNVRYVTRTRFLIEIRISKRIANDEVGRNKKVVSIVSETTFCRSRKGKEKRGGEKKTRTKGETRAERKRERGREG